MRSPKRVWRGPSRAVAGCRLHVLSSDLRPEMRCRRAQSIFFSSANASESTFFRTSITSLGACIVSVLLMKR